MTEKGNVATNYTYDRVSRLTKAQTLNGAGETTNPLRTFTYTYGRHSNLTKEQISGRTPQLDTGTTPCPTMTPTNSAGVSAEPQATVVVVSGEAVLLGFSVHGWRDLARHIESGAARQEDLEDSTCSDGSE